MDLAASVSVRMARCSASTSSAVPSMRVVAAPGRASRISPGRAASVLVSEIMFESLHNTQDSANNITSWFCMIKYLRNMDGH